ncbi:hypothetical protein CMEL01_16821 [Colletotrichum melonis]|uniref:Uncharacterized protein n=1 Tax=Colletotrichum melonis TaxID=1209925 RepID=A0AAI9XFD6_9PEZI|nr:hypothetical protein CMEL01_16821 [Colletotrichum melonis]
MAPPSLNPKRIGRDVLDGLGVNSLVRSGRSVGVLSALTIARELPPRRDGKPILVVRKHRVLSVLVQTTGSRRRVSCERCSRGNGPWKDCVAPNGPEGAEATKGACANYSSSAKRPRKPMDIGSRNLESMSLLSPLSVRGEGRREEFWNPIASLRAPMFAMMPVADCTPIHADLVERLETARTYIAQFINESHLLSQQLLDIASPPLLQASERPQATLMAGCRTMISSTPPCSRSPDEGDNTASPLSSSLGTASTLSAPSAEHGQAAGEGDKSHEIPDPPI